MPKTSAETAQELARLSSDCSFLLTHLIRQKGDGGREEAKEILKLILDYDGGAKNPILKGSSVGWYSAASPKVFNPRSGELDGEKSCKAACFTDSTLSGLKAHRDVFGSCYGVAFDRSVLFEKGANPCLNVRSELLQHKILRNGERYPRHLYNFIPQQLQPYVNIIHECFDATHEREWRVAGDMEFAIEDIMFVYCPEDDFAEFSALQNNGKPALFDLAWLDRI